MFLKDGEISISADTRQFYSVWKEGIEVSSYVYAKGLLKA